MSKIYTTSAKLANWVDISKNKNCTTQANWKDLNEILSEIYQLEEYHNAKIKALEEQVKYLSELHNQQVADIARLMENKQ